LRLSWAGCWRSQIAELHPNTAVDLARIVIGLVTGNRCVTKRRKQTEINCAIFVLSNHTIELETLQNAIDGRSVDLILSRADVARCVAQDGQRLIDQFGTFALQGDVADSELTTAAG
jgi:hypothetical protein